MGMLASRILALVDPQHMHKSLSFNLGTPLFYLRHSNYPLFPRHLLPQILLNRRPLPQSFLG